MTRSSNTGKATAGHITALLVIAGLTAAPLLMSPLLPARTIFWFEVQNAAHFVVFFVVAWLFLGVFRMRDGRDRLLARRRYLQVLVLCMLLGAGTEALQFFLPRDADVIDFLRNVAGTFVALALYRWIDLFKHKQAAKARDRLLLALGGLTVLVALGTVAGWAVSYVERDARFPMLEDFETRPWPSFVTPKGARVRWVPAPSGFADLATGKCLEVAFRGKGWPGFELREPFPDWRGYQILEIAVLNPTREQQSLHVRIDDALYNDGYDDRYNGVFTLEPGANVIEIDLQAIREGPRGRTLDLGRVASLILFSRAEDRPFVLFFDNLRLVRAEVSSN